MSNGVRATKSAESRRGYLDLDTHLELRRDVRIVQAKRHRWRVSLHIDCTFGRYLGVLRHVPFVPEPWQAPA